jgi:hypothetical protein
VTLVEAPVHSHRRGIAARSRTGRFAIRVGAAVAILACVAVGSAFTDRVPSSDALQGPYVRTGAVGAQVDARTLEVTVVGVRGASVLTQDGHTYATGGIWIIVTVRLAARSNPTPLNYAVLTDTDGRVYRPTDRIDQVLLRGEPIEPGVAVTADIAFEVPTSVATELSVDLAGDPSDGDDQRMDALARIRIPITAAEVSQWKASTTAATLAGPALVR